MSPENQPQSATHALVLSEGATASTDYFVLPYLKKLDYSTVLRDARLAAMEVDELRGFQLVVISRYLPRKWKQALRSFREAGGRIVYFMDDDLFDMRALKGLPARYQWKILRFALLQRGELERLCDEYWFSTPYLAHKYPQLNPVLLEPVPSVSLLMSSPAVQICYHGTASHAAEFEWLLGVMGAVQQRSQVTHFEIFGGPKLRRLYAGVPRVSVVQPMSWPDYLARTGCVRRSIALAPVLASTFNAGRGYTKFFDYARLGAAGVYSDVAPYQGFVRDGVDGVLLKNDPALWSEVILGLAADADRREKIAANARKRALHIADE